VRIRNHGDRTHTDAYVFMQGMQGMQDMQGMQGACYICPTLNQIEIYLQV